MFFSAKRESFYDNQGVQTEKRVVCKWKAMIKHETEENVVAPNAIEAFFPPLAARTLLLKRLKTLNFPNQK